MWESFFVFAQTKRLPCAKGAPALAGEGLFFAIILNNQQIGSMYKQSLRHGYAMPPPFAQGRLFVWRGLAQGRPFVWQVHKGVLFVRRILQ